MKPTKKETKPMKKTAFQLISSTRAIIAFIFLTLLSLQASAGTLLPNAKQIFFNTDGSPCAGCSVYHYIPSTTTFKDTYQDAAETILNTNPVITDSAGMALIYGTGDYRQILKDATAATIWDKPTSDVSAVGVIEFAGTSGGSANAQEVTASNFTSTNGQAIAFYAGFSNTTAATLKVNAGSPIAIRKGVSTGPSLLDGGEIITGNLVIVYYDSVGGYFQMVGNAALAQVNDENTFSGVQTFSASPVLSAGVSSAIGPLNTPCGRLTLTSGVSVLASDVTGATTVYYTPYNCNLISLYDGTNWNTVSFAEVSQTLADSTKSPSAAGVSQIYDMFGWLDSGTFRVTRGPTWATGGGSATARGTGAGSTALELVNGVWTNDFSITNGPSANRGIYLGTISTDANGANGQLNMMFAPAAAAGGTNNRIDIFNNYNQVPFVSVVRDSTDTWVYNTATWRPYNGAASNIKNRVTVVNGLAGGAHYTARALGVFTCSTGTTQVRIGVGIDSITAPSQIISGHGLISGTAPVSAEGSASVNLGSGSHFFQMLEKPETSTTTFYGDGGDPTDEQSGLFVWGMM